MALEPPAIGIYLIIVISLLIVGIVGSILIVWFRKRGRLGTVLRLWEVVLLALIVSVMLYSLMWAGVLGSQLAESSQAYAEVLPF